MSEFLTRRAALFAGVGAAAAAAAGGPAFAVAAPTDAATPDAFSPEYYAAYQSWIDCERVKDVQARYDVSEAEALAETRAIEGWREAKDALLARPCEGLLDVLALLRTNAWQAGHFIRIQDWAGDEMETLRAVEALAGVAPWPVPEDLVALDEKKQAEIAARPRIMRVNYEKFEDWRDDILEI